MATARVRRSGFVLAMLVVSSLVLASGSLKGVAQDSGGDEAIATDVSVYATGLNNPRGLDFDSEGNLWVAEAGRGAETIGPNTPSVEDPEGGGAVYIGDTGAFSKITDGEVDRVYTDLPSIAGEDGSAAIGPLDVSIDSSGGARGVIGLGASPDERDQVAPDSLFGHLIRVDSNGDVVQQTDVSAFEGQQNPDGGEVDTNPNGVLAADNGGSYVADAGGNDLLYVDSDGNISVTSIFVPRLTATPEFLQGAPFPPEIPMQSVPTAAAFGPDGAVYVSELTGFPFTEGEANIWRVEPGQPAELYESGFTNIIDLAFDGDGNLYVLEIDSNGLATPPDFNGALWRISADSGDRELVAGPDDLSAPGGMTIGPDGAIYVTNNSVMAENGEVLRIEVGNTGGSSDNNGDNGSDDQNGSGNQDGSNGGDMGNDNGGNGGGDSGN